MPICLRICVIIRKVCSIVLWTFFGFIEKKGIFLRRKCNTSSMRVNAILVLRLIYKITTMEILHRKTVYLLTKYN